MKTVQNSRFDTRLPKEQKVLFEYAANLGGFRTLTEFVIFSAQQQADNIIEKHNAVLASERDKKIFFNAITTPQKPNSILKKAAIDYDKAAAKK